MVAAGRAGGESRIAEFELVSYELNSKLGADTFDFNFPNGALVSTENNGVMFSHHGRLIPVGQSNLTAVPYWICGIGVVAILGTILVGIRYRRTHA